MDNKNFGRNDSVLYHASVIRKTVCSIPAIIAFMVILSVTSFAVAEQSLVPSYGEGKYELFVFTDYFCPPCQGLEADMEPALKRLLATTGGVRVTFVDVPLHQYSLLYIKYFLYAANAGAKNKDILRARNILFSLAKSNTVTTEDDLANALRKQRVAFKPYDLKNVFAALTEIVRKHNIRSTPTCIVKYSDTDVRKYTGGDEIKKGLSLLQTHLKNPQR
jgi:protein-disulfide isomerase